MPSPYLDDCLKRKLLFFTGKGGVGKSAIAWATAELLQKSGRNVLFINWNPFLASAARVGYQVPGIPVLQLKSLECFKEYVLQVLKFERLYDAIFENRVLRTFVQAAPGLAETVVAGKIWQLFDKTPNTVFIVDLPASGHAFSFFQSPLGIQRMFSLGFVHKESTKIAEMFKHSQVRLDFVAIPEEMSLMETKEFHDKLKALHPFSFGFAHINQCTPDFGVSLPLPGDLPCEVRKTIERWHQQRVREAEALREIALPLPQIQIPKLPAESASAITRHISTVLGQA